ncbi:hypothetical protein IWC96_00185 [Brevundimonas sp. BAL450]|jgi:hypothetical protein|uniref:hypothetical protein n=1 Tax=Brevundimonas TaxID=41275 RepID=UPI0018CB0564|nr:MULTISPECIES: hypothetical protein [Brevundimonas]MBG7613698.1 hypothetical protein [Brevundimonas sp. BAL450]
MDGTSDLADMNRRLRRVTLQSRVQMGVLAVMMAVGLAAFVSDEPRALRVSELVVVDPDGVERVRISGDLPDAVVDGRRLVRGEKAAGVILYDGAGRERSGYATFEPSGNVLLTLDNRQSEQNALFVAGPDNAAALRLWQGRDAIDLRTDPAGTRMTIVEDGLVRHQTPVTPIPPEACEAYRGAVPSLGREVALRECNGRFTADNCDRCLTP